MRLSQSNTAVAATMEVELARLPPRRRRRLTRAMSMQRASRRNGRKRTLQAAPKHFGLGVMFRRRMGPLTKLVSWLLFPQEPTFGASMLSRSGGQCTSKTEKFTCA
jgi:hypothetical protein